MVAVINGNRLTEKTDFKDIPSFDPNKELTVVINVRAIAEEKKAEVSSQKKIAVFRPEQFKKAAKKQRFEVLRIKRKKADQNEITIRVKNKINRFSQVALRNTRFAEDVGKGRSIDITA